MAKHKKRADARQERFTFAVEQAERMVRGKPGFRRPSQAQLRAGKAFGHPKPIEPELKQ